MRPGSARPSQGAYPKHNAFGRSTSGQGFGV